VRVGIDLVMIEEFGRVATRMSPRLTRYLFADTELAQAAVLQGTRHQEFLAGVFAAKEAVLKTLGVGLFQGVTPSDIALTRLPGGAPQVTLHGSASRAVQRLNIKQVTVSITHTRGLAAVIAVGW
jgi:holo-[acyl-carrier protein] synthase